MNTLPKFLAVAIGALTAMPLWATTLQLQSPNSQLVVTLDDADGRPTYSIQLNGKTLLQPSALGLKLDLADYTRDLQLQPAPQQRTIDEHYTVPTIKQRNVHYVANEAIVTFQQGGKKAFDVVFRIANNDVAFRYDLQPVGQKMTCVVQQEATGFVFDATATTSFLCPQMNPMTGFADTAPSYETSYTPDDALGKNGWGHGYTFPCLFRCGDQGWVLLSETGVSSAYCASRLVGNPDGSYSLAFPMEAECNGLASSTPGVMLPGSTPWRTITVGQDLAPIVETTVPWDVVTPLYEPSQTYTYGKGSWSWIIGMDSSCNFDEQKRYVDFSAAMGYQTVLVDALWDVQIGRDRMKQLADYARSKGVALFLWYNSNGYWNSAPQSPRGIMNNAIARKREMKWMRELGIRGIKVDFFGGDKQVMMQLYEEILSDANDYGIEVIFHGCTLPRGWERMYPNFVASEAVLASENLHFGQGSCDREAFDATMHPFVRNTVGSMDFGGSTLNKHYNVDNKRGTRRMTSDVAALAMAVLFQSPVQHFAMAPNNLTDAPAWAIDFMKRVPTQWDEVRYLAGYPGKYIILARRQGDLWYVAGINAQKEPLKLTLQLPMWAAGSSVQLTMDQPQWTVDNDVAPIMKACKLNKKQELKVVLPSNGALLIE